MTWTDLTYISYGVRNLSLVFILCFTFLIPSLSQANDSELIQWSSTDVQFLRGFNYQLGNSERTILTFQHTHGWTYGDNFLFYDKTLNGQDYFEWHPRLSLGKISGQAVELGPIKDLFLAATVEVPETGQARHLIGVGLDWDILNLDYFKTNFYMRDNPALAGTTWGTTFSWKKKFTVGQHAFLFDGFMDMAGSEGGREAYQLIVPTFLTDVGTYFGHKERAYLGVEYQYWHNKFGVRDVDESVAQLEFRWIIK